ncbi:autotransporter outer membrane beta-barrel domain-containing protein [Wohlfahrtiimonas chitiniclastica]|uniref:autotransporter outer membrane beta-barrel domain-containing protein n=1 Tax=Wohlfahrtiimonas chitiniclastica TaxID=400946 RepID=UPI001BCDEF45|nr:autotransporter outer membrane beta-barrel domain-containing protein [Wohlfahrtiimonas chitiniclastica]MBS7816388.1 autotransporter outer membrane beta-barrel domain-containing protein [Wohlfahrtiimonas chitiniclastica]MBS7823573.1 autotransporter outer membrane beta-barrel domain-containing protein [Wohlfahrtiimonas chitiniclastica]MBS7831370.1 autotransporter outer membrane beta-barrel domain-containing protein [Wohlfahrtiimonas chitiniclastica]MBS7831376.1 autotransporter outer membrane b
MNKVFKIVWSMALNQWVVTSELGKSHQKSKSTTVKAAVAGVVALMGANAFAETKGINGFEGFEPAPQKGDLVISNNNQTQDVPSEHYQPVSGVRYDEKISGDKNIYFGATDIQYKPILGVADPNYDPYADHSGEPKYDHNGHLSPFSKGDRYGRDIHLVSNNGAENDFKGDIYVTPGVNLYIGDHQATSTNLLGQDNDMIIEGYTLVTIDKSMETLKNLTFKNNDSAKRIENTRCEGTNTPESCDNSYNGSNGDALGYDINHAYNNGMRPHDPIYDEGGGAFYIRDNADLTVTDNVEFSGSTPGTGADFNASSSSFAFQKDTNFTNGSRLFASRSEGTLEGAANFNGHGAGLHANDESNIHMTNKTWKGGSDSSKDKGYNTVSTGSTISADHGIEFHNQSITINDGLSFVQEYIGTDPETDEYLYKINTSFPQRSEGYAKKSTLNVGTADQKADFTLASGDNIFNVINSDVNVHGNFTAKENDNLSFSMIHGALNVEDTISLSANDAELVIINSTIQANNFIVDNANENEKSAFLGNTLDIAGDFTLANHAQIYDASYFDGSNDDRKFNAPGLKSPEKYELTYDQLINFLKDDAAAAIDVDAAASLTANNVNMRNAAIYKTAGDVTVKSTMNVEDQAEFTATKGDINIGEQLTVAKDAKLATLDGNITLSDAKGSQVDGTLGIAEGKQFDLTAGNLIIDGQQYEFLGTLNVADGATLQFNGAADLTKESARLNNKGTITALSGAKLGQTLNDGSIHAYADSEFGHVTNNGIIQLAGANDNGTANRGKVTFNGNYIGNGGTLVFGAVNADNIKRNTTTDGAEVNPFDTTHKDLLIITGDASGNTNVIVQKIEGQFTDQGILLINVQGTSEATAFQLDPSRRVRSGVTDFTALEKRGNDWYLVGSTEFKPSIPWTPLEPANPIEKPEEPSEPVDPCDTRSSSDTCAAPAPTPEEDEPQQDETPVTPTQPNKPEPSKPAPAPIYSPETVAYLSQHATANHMFNLKFHDRLYLPGENGVWVHAQAGFNKMRSSLTQDISAKMDYYTIHIGKDLVENELYQFGIMAAYGHASGTSRNHRHGIKADMDSNGFAVGVYGSYTPTEHRYIDAWVQYAYLRNKVTGEKSSSEKYNSRGLLASIEAGYAFNISENSYFQPQVQLTYMGVKSDRHEEANGNIVTSNSGNVQIRVGARVYGDKTLFNGSTTPYMELNYFHNTKPFKVNVQNGNGMTSISQQNARDIYQIEVGFTSQLNKDLRLTGGVSYAQGKKRQDYRDTKVRLDLRYNF